MMRYSVILFDLDGTILNTLDDLAASTNRALAKNGLPTRSTDEVRRFVGNGIRLLIERAVPENTPLALTALFPTTAYRNCFARCEPRVRAPR